MRAQASLCILLNEHYPLFDLPDDRKLSSIIHRVLILGSYESFVIDKSNELAVRTHCIACEGALAVRGNTEIHGRCKTLPSQCVLGV